MEARLLGWPDARSVEEGPSKSVVKAHLLGLAEFAEHGVNGVESGVDLLSDLTRKR